MGRIKKGGGWDKRFKGAGYDARQDHVELLR